VTVSWSSRTPTSGSLMRAGTYAITISPRGYV